MAGFHKMKGRTASSPDDEELVRAFQTAPDSARGREAVELLLGRWCDRVYLWCFRVVRDRELALDLAQDVLVRAYQALPERMVQNNARMRGIDTIVGFPPGARGHPNHHRPDQEGCADAPRNEELVFKAQARADRIRHGKGEQDQDDVRRPE